MGSVESTSRELVVAQQEAKSGTVRGRSTIEFPYFDLISSLEVTQAAHNVGGTGCDWVQLAVEMKQAPQGGGFRMRAMSARSFGLLDYDRGAVALTDLGIKSIDPRYEKGARVEAFLCVPLFKQMYERLKGQIIPPPPAIERMMVDLGVAPKQKDKARQVFLRSATQAGFRDADQERLVAPSIKAQQDSTEQTQEQTNEKGKGGGNGSSGNYHPFIEGLLRTLPEPETEWPIAGRMKWLQTASNVFGLIYATKDDDGVEFIEITKKAV